MPPTLDGVCLPGWMERDYALNFFKDDCHFDQPHTDAELADIWQMYRTRVEALPARKAAAPAAMTLSPVESKHVAQFMAFLKQSRITNIQSAIKVDLKQLVIRQFVVVTDNSEGYRLKCSTPKAWMEECLPTSIVFPNVPANVQQKGLDTEIDYDLPHAEFSYLPTPQGFFGALQWVRHVTATNGGNRLLLWSGYHRSYARVLSIAPTASVWPTLVALTTNVIAPPSGGAGVTQAGDDLGLFGTRPPLFADFFDDGLRMTVRLRKKRYQLQVRAKWVATNEP